MNQLVCIGIARVCYFLALIGLGLWSFKLKLFSLTFYHNVQDWLLANLKSKTFFFQVNIFQSPLLCYQRRCTKILHDSAGVQKNLSNFFDTISIKRSF